MGLASRWAWGGWTIGIRRDSAAWSVTLLVLAIAALAVTRNNADADLWGHVQYGRDLLETGHLPATTTYSFTAEGYRWINHENLAELLYAWGFDHLGVVPLVILKSLLGYAVLATACWFGLRSGAGRAAVATVVLLMAVNLTLHWSMRPQLFTYLSYAFMLAWLTWCFEGWQGTWRLPLSRAARERMPPLRYSSRRLRALWVMPVLFAFWANAHGGFVAGYCLFAGYLGLRAIEAVAMRGRAAGGLVKRFALMIFCGGLATLLNPYSFRLHAWLLEALGRPWPEIAEWHGPSLADSMSRPWWLLLAALIVTMLASRRAHDLTHLGVLAVTLWQASLHQRHVPFFAIAFGFWMAPHVQSLLDRVLAPRARMRPVPAALRYLVTGGSLAAALLLIAVMVRRNTDLTVYRHEYPVSALEFVTDRHLQGNMVVTYDWAQYVLAACGAREPGQRGIRVACDGRFNTCYPQAVIDMHFDFALGDAGPRYRCRDAASGPFDPTRVLNYSQPPYDAPELVLIARRQQHAEQTMQQQQQSWVLLYQDDVAQLWGRSSIYDNVRHADYLPPARRVLAGGKQRGHVTWPAWPRSCVAREQARNFET